MLLRRPHAAPLLLLQTSQGPSSSRLPPCSAAAALQRVVDKAQKDFSLTFQLGFELEFYLLRPPSYKEGDSSGSGGSGGNGGGSSSSRAGVPPPIDTSNYCHSGALDAAAAGACGVGGLNKT
jgi:glutamine synthetase